MTDILIMIVSAIYLLFIAIIALCWLAGKVMETYDDWRR